jgi:hypothetical protein
MKAFFIDVVSVQEAVVDSWDDIWLRWPMVGWKAGLRISQWKTFTGIHKQGFKYFQLQLDTILAALKL